MRTAWVAKPVSPELIAAYDEGASIPALALRAGVSKWTMRCRLVEAGAKIRRSQVKPPTVEQQDAIRRYEAGATIAQVAKEIGRSFTFVQKALQRYGDGQIRRRPRDLGRATPDEIIARYAAGESRSQIVAATAASESTVRATLRDADVAMRSRGAPRKWVVDDAFFDEPWTEANAYWCGFLLADGCLYSGGDGQDRVQIGLGTVGDEVHLRRFCDVVSPGRAICETSRDGLPLWIVAVCSDHMAARLRCLGVTERKSATATPPVLPEAVARHFWRGVLDGDGGISFGAARATVSAYVYGSEATVRAFVTWARGQLGRGGGSIGPQTNAPTCWGAKFEGTHLPIALLRELYRNATIWLPRKYVLWQEAERRLAPRMARRSPRVVEAGRVVAGSRLQVQSVRLIDAFEAHRYPAVMPRLIHKPTGVEYSEEARAGKIGRGEARPEDFEVVEDPAPALAEPEAAVPLADEVPPPSTATRATPPEPPPKRRR